MTTKKTLRQLLNYTLRTCRYNNIIIDTRQVDDNIIWSTLLMYHVRARENVNR